MYNLSFKVGFSIALAAAYVQATSVFDCLDAKKVPYLTSSSPDWVPYQIPFNLRLSYEPTVITVPENDAQVSASVTCAAAASLKVQAKGGGHSYASYSSGGKNGSLVIEMEKFSEVTVDQTTFIAKIGAGQRLGNVATAIYAQGKRAMPHGTCAGVGIAGHALHGGYGYDSRKWGLALDHIVGLDVALADGTCVYTDATHEPELFWAMRGAGDSFGIATHFYMQTNAAPDSVIWFTANVASTLSSAEVAASAFESLQTWSLTSSDLTPNITFGTYVDTNHTYTLRGWCMDCDVDVFSKDVFPSMLAGFPGAVPTVQNTDWINALTILADPDPLSQPLGHLYKLHDTFYAKSVVSKEAEPLSHASLLSYFDYIIKNYHNKQWFSIINLYGAPGSAINAVPADASAYSDRESLWVFQNYGTTGSLPWDDELTVLIDGMNDATTVPQPDGDFGGYLNYVDPDLSPAQAHLEYYGASTYDVLLGLKYKYDPAQVFWNPQAIGTSMLLF